jgi:hypothetical protein
VFATYVQLVTDLEEEQVESEATATGEPIPADSNGLILYWAWLWPTQTVGSVTLPAFQGDRYAQRIW